LEDGEAVRIALVLEEEIDIALLLFHGLHLVKQVGEMLTQIWIDEALLLQGQGGEAQMGADLDRQIRVQEVACDLRPRKFF